MAGMPENAGVVEKYYLLFGGKVLKGSVFLYYHEVILNSGDSGNQEMGAEEK